MQLSKIQLELASAASAATTVANGLGVCIAGSLTESAPEIAPLAWVIVGICFIGFFGSLIVANLFDQALCRTA